MTRTWTSSCCAAMGLDPLREGHMAIQIRRRELITLLGGATPRGRSRCGRRDALAAARLAGRQTMDE
jgi:hypothetical protein